MQAMKKSAVLYHYPCPDGVFAALAAHLYFSAAKIPVAFFPNTVYDPIRTEHLPLDEIDDIYLLDFVGPSGFVGDLSSKVKNVILLDHHKTALEAFCGSASIDNNVTKVIDMERSGATIAFDFFKEKLLSRANISGNHEGTDRGDNGVTFLPKNQFDRVNKLFKFIEDGDLWKWRLPHSKAFSSGFKDLHLEYNVNLNPNLFNQLLALDPGTVIGHGEETLSRKQKPIEEVLEQSFEIALGRGLFGHCLAVCADSVSNLRSELGHQLANKSRNQNLRGIGGVVYKVAELNNDEMLKISLRSVDIEDTTPISQEYGGGGHRNASSFLMSSAEFEKWKVRTKAS